MIFKQHGLRIGVVQLSQSEMAVYNKQAQSANPRQWDIKCDRASNGIVIHFHLQHLFFRVPDYRSICSHFQLVGFCKNRLFLGRCGHKQDWQIWGDSCISQSQGARHCEELSNGEKVTKSICTRSYKRVFGGIQVKEGDPPLSSLPMIVSCV